MQAFCRPGFSSIRDGSCGRRHRARACAAHLGPQHGTVRAPELPGFSCAQKIATTKQHAYSRTEKVGTWLSSNLKPKKETDSHISSYIHIPTVLESTVLPPSLFGLLRGLQQDAASWNPSRNTCAKTKKKGGLSLSRAQVLTCGCWEPPKISAASHMDSM